MTQAASKHKVGVLGAGLMGHGIAQLLALGGCPVTLFDQDPQMLASAPERIRRNFEVFLKLGMVAPEQVDQTLANITLCDDMAQLCAGREFIIEAVSENLEVKQAVFAVLEELAPADCILASNTSTISIQKIAQDLKTPERVLGTHFWNPPQVVPGVEVIKSPATSDRAFAAMCELLASVGKKPIKVLKDVPGFIGNRMQHALWREAIQLVERGIASAEDVDDVVRYCFGLRMAFLGPLATADLAGLDLTYEIHKDFLAELDCSPEPSPLLAEKYNAGQLGAKSGQGFHAWTPEKLSQLLARRDEVLLRILGVVLPPEGE
ncbi:MAG: 3-hydroxyacyl-CoA dehydrogenase family protein [Desulfarculaceae bacterium]|nr:3-hydroxyacyl-CoA dehydrogenase family protein [Desulfarculaceae bacterium]MCF8070749.1 3-hydroxyacyl-CoA dehydrogenase family protein [Desulfarculaceae bacterium]MCF8102186.1 3-hydroxyacyl-CoA dehydrogenase family protein [Desulfarculaceae bacterium]MCF8117015.1 3-hydroxyacyl-CoA dehydrogenase family protein [Desulfarculaceae bacterium]